MVNYNSVDLYDAEVAAIGAGIGVGYLIFIFAIALFAIISMWKVFTKAGKPGWASLIPIYNMVVMLQIAGMSGWMVLLMGIPVANVIVTILMYINIAKAFGKGAGFGIGLILLNPIFMAILGFGSAEYEGV